MHVCVTLAGLARGHGGLVFQSAFEGCKDIRLGVEAQVAFIRTVPHFLTSGLPVRDFDHLTINSSSMDWSLHWVTVGSSSLGQWEERLEGGGCGKYYVRWLGKKRGKSDHSKTIPGWKARESVPTSGWALP